MMLVVLIMGAAWWTVTAVSKPLNRLALERDHNARVLAQAKQALLGWAAYNAYDDTDDNPGRLPCPEAAGYIGTDNEGVMSSFCGSGMVIGRLPWRSLGLPKLLDATGEPLWYAVSNDWKLNVGGAFLGINSNSAAQLALDGAAASAVAIIIAPGRPLTLAPNATQLAAGCIARTQTRHTSPPNYLDYVECQNVAGASVRTVVVDNVTNTVSNDQAVALTAPEVLAAIEPTVAARITRDVVPTLKNIFGATYATAQWGVSATTPVLPFAAQFESTASSSFQGKFPETQGLLPLSRSNCNPATDALCDTGFVRWDTASVSVTKRSGLATVTSTDCSASTTTEVSCTINYQRTCSGVGCLLGCACPATLEASVFANAQNVAMAARSFSNAGITGFASIVSTNTPLNSAGAAVGDFRGHLTTPSCTAWFIFGLLFPCTASNSVTVKVPITAFPDHASLTAFYATASLNWFVKNNWHHVVYYAMSPSHAASGLIHDCTSAGDCITVNGGSIPANSRAVIVFAGRKLTGINLGTRPSADRSDYLDTPENSGSIVINTTFEQKRFDKSFNDRFFAISNY